jgi:hypothetical protein
MKRILIIALILCAHIGLRAQKVLDSLQLTVGTNMTIASKDYQPLWLVANRFGVISDQKFDFSTHVRATNSHQFDVFNVEYGIDVYNNDHLSKTILQEGFARVRYKNLSLTGGRFKQIIGEVDPDLSSGSLGVSGNALPIPKININLAYSDIPFTNGWIQFKGTFSHGWMGDNQFMKHAFLHEKSLYFRVGKHKLKLYGGIEHFALWGGSREDYFSTNRKLSGFFDVVLGKEANDGSVRGDIAPNRAGDHRGVLEAGVEWENDDYKFQLNNQTPFDTGQGIDIRNIDRLLSLNFINKQENSILKKLVFEFIYTKQSNDFYASAFRESYYNNGIYRTGWEYNDQIIGTPLFINRVRGSNYFDNIEPYNWDAPQKEIPAVKNIIANRVVGGHVGVILALTDEISSTTKVTYTNNYGTFDPLSNFYPSKSQWYTMQQFNWNLPDTQLSLTGALAYDFGKISTNFGSMIGVQWQLRK